MGTMPIFKATICNSSGCALDHFTAQDIEDLSRQLGKRLIYKYWLLNEGDSIHVERVENGHADTSFVR